MTSTPDPPLSPEARPPSSTTTARAWLVRHAFGVACCALGLLSLGLATFVTLEAGSIMDTPDPRLTVPFFIAVLAAGVTSLVRKEGTYTLALVGACSAGSALVLGWMIVLAIVGVITAALIAILSEVM